MTEEDEAFNEIERMSKVREVLRSLNRKRQIQDAEYKDMIAKAVAKEREACAKLAENRGLLGADKKETSAYQFACKSIAESIRARGQA